MFDDAAGAEPPEKLHNLLMQCAIQAQISYYNEFKNEVMTKWLGAFLGHSHLSVKRVSDRGCGVLLYKGLSNNAMRGAARQGVAPPRTVAIARARRRVSVHAVVVRVPAP